MTIDKRLIAIGIMVFAARAVVAATKTPKPVARYAGKDAANEITGDVAHQALEGPVTRLSDNAPAGRWRAVVSQFIDIGLNRS
jgi:hypothetical protein